jgi:tRNA(adenine34) deaminase
MNLDAPDPVAAGSAEDLRHMRRALALAACAEAEGEVPVGAVLVGADGAVLAEGWNRPIARHDPTAHAEIMAMRAAAERLANYRLTGTTLYVTLEPCVMCAGAIIHARVARLVYAARDPKAGAVDSVYDVIARPQLNHATACQGGLLEAESAAMLRRFFRTRRNGANARAR